jgi:hypothetical protein
MYLQVMEQLANLDAKMTYSQARSAAVGELNSRRLTETLVYEHWHKKTAAHLEQQHLQQHPQLHQQQHQQPHQQQPQGQQDSARPLLMHSASTASRRHWGGQHNASGRALTVAGSAAAHRDPEAAAAAAAGALSEMKQWAIDQELSMMEVCTSLRTMYMHVFVYAFEYRSEQDVWVRMVFRCLGCCVQIIHVPHACCVVQHAVPAELAQLQMHPEGVSGAFVIPSVLKTRMQQIIRCVC